MTELAEKIKSRIADGVDVSALVSALQEVIEECDSCVDVIYADEDARLACETEAALANHILYIIATEFEII